MARYHHEPSSRSSSATSSPCWPPDPTRGGRRPTAGACSTSQPSPDASAGAVDADRSRKRICVYILGPPSSRGTWVGVVVPACEVRHVLQRVTLVDLHPDAWACTACPRPATPRRTAASSSLNRRAATDAGTALHRTATPPHPAQTTWPLARTARSCSHSFGGPDGVRSSRTPSSRLSRRRRTHRTALHLDGDQHGERVQRRQQLVCGQLRDAVEATSQTTQRGALYTRLLGDLARAGAGRRRRRRRQWSPAPCRCRTQRGGRARGRPRWRARRGAPRARATCVELQVHETSRSRITTSSPATTACTRKRALASVARHHLHPSEDRPSLG